MRDHRRVLTWPWRAWAATPLVVVSYSLLIGYLHTAGRLHPLMDQLESLVGLGFAGLACLPLIVGACYLDMKTNVPRWLVWVPFVLVWLMGLVMFSFRKEML
ncbi:MAG TPA: hypothetical protein VGJ91_12065, partial [Polyangiaceae bacterium]